MIDWKDFDRQYNKETILEVPTQETRNKVERFLDLVRNGEYALVPIIDAGISLQFDNDALRADIDFFNDLIEVDIWDRIHFGPSDSD